LECTVFGASGATRLVVVLREDGAASIDPDARATASHDVRVLAIQLRSAEVAAPGAYGGETAGSTTVAALELVIDQQMPDPGASIGLVGVAGAGAEAVLLAQRLGSRVDRMVLVAVPYDDSALERHLAEQVMSEVTADTLILNGADDPDASADAASWHEAHLRDARVELIPVSVYGPDPHLGIADVWDRALSHLTSGRGSG
jgi:pimeloyl-ACP methyl ester carboxylesterase